MAEVKVATMCGLTLLTLDPLSDVRHDFTWRERYANVPNRAEVFNAYSSTEDILEVRDAAGGWLTELLRNVWYFFSEDEMGRGSWQAQEVWKGRNQIGWPYDITHDYGGWAFSRAWRYTRWGLRWGPRVPARRPISPSHSTLIMPEDLKEKPFFKKGSLRSPSGISALYGTDEAAASFISANESQLFARMIPAITGPAGGREVPGLGQDPVEGENIDFSDYRDVANWPRIQGNQKPWWHRDHRWVAYPYVFKFYEKIVGDEVLDLK